MLVKRFARFGKLAVLVAALLAVLIAALAATTLVVNQTVIHRARRWPAASDAVSVRSFSAFISRIDALPDCPRLKRSSLGRARYRGSAYPLIVLSFPAPSNLLGTAKVLLVSGMHGNETAGIEALVQLADRLAHEPALYLGLTIDIVPIANPWGWVHSKRYNGTGEDPNRDFASQRTQEAVLLRNLVRAKGPYDLVIDLHESRKSGYFMYRYVGNDGGLSSAYTAVLKKRGVRRESEYREALFRVKDGVITIPNLALWFAWAARRLAFDHYTRLHGTRLSFTLESPLQEPFGARVATHLEALHTLIQAFTERHDT